MIDRWSYALQAAAGLGPRRPTRAHKEELS